jgi:hypothetical protein
MNRLGLAVLILTSLAQAARAQTGAPHDAGLTVTVPDSWKLVVKDAGITGESKDKEVALLVWSVDSADAEVIEKKLEGELFSAVANVKWDKPTTGKVHGLAATYFTSTGHAVGGDVAIRAAVIGPGPVKKSLLAAVVVKVDKLAKHTSELQAILASVQRAK